MSTTIPYDPSLILGNIVPEEKLTVLEAISDLQTPIDAAQGELNSAILLRRKLDMTMQELVSLNVDTTEVAKSVADVGKTISDAAVQYASVSVDALPKIRDERAKIAQVGSSVESPIDYNRSQIKRLPLAADSMTMDAQYFSFDENKQSSDSSMAALKSFVSASTSFMGNDRSSKMTASAQAQVNKQREVHDIQGTLVITANCTHEQAALFAPFFIDVDKGIRAWNAMFPDQMIKMDDAKTVKDIIKKGSTKDAKTFKLLSGAAYGSSFVGMVHVLKESSTTSDQQMYAAAASLQASMKVDSSIAKAEGGFGVSGTLANSAKRLLSNQQISSHVSLVTMGIIPTIVANDVQLTVKQFAKFSPDEMMNQLSVLQSATAAEQDSVAASADAAQTGATITSLRAAKIKSVMSAVGELQDGANKMLDVNSLMTAFTDYVAKASAGQAGVPIEYYLKPISAVQLAEMWVAKYLPGKYVTDSGDDSEPSEPEQKAG